VVTYEADAWAALGDRTRRTIFTRLSRRPCAVGELARELPVSRPAVSQHLRVLKEAGLVTDRAEGTRRVYQVNPEGLEQLRSELDQFWSSTLASFKATGEHREKEQR
jgi:DNA-binding transcriptional ArsR family regulator